MGPESTSRTLVLMISTDKEIITGKWKVFVYATEDRNDTILEGENGAFSSIAIVKMGWCQLEVYLLCFHKLF